MVKRIFVITGIVFVLISLAVGAGAKPKTVNFDIQDLVYGFSSKSFEWSKDNSTLRIRLVTEGSANLIGDSGEFDVALNQVFDLVFSLYDSVGDDVFYAIKGYSKAWTQGDWNGDGVYDYAQDFRLRVNGFGVYNKSGPCTISELTLVGSGNGGSKLSLFLSGEFLLQPTSDSDWLGGSGTLQISRKDAP